MSDPSPYAMSLRSYPGGHCWRVEVMRKGEVFRKYFTAARYGSVEQARVAAEAWRNMVCERHPLHTAQEVSQRLTVRNTSGCPGVYRIRTRRKRPDGTVREHWHWEARTPNGIKPTKKRAFAVERYGEQGAYDRAVAARQEFVQALTGYFVGGLLTWHKDDLPGLALRQGAESAPTDAPLTPARCGSRTP
ncbi:hypothetical protein GTZ97_03465 [Aquabacterium fontiphilum]|uniref:AP2 domain-containing protein n=1 Tax=Aquabacterium fontiphilum TaxID=450365 RepID=UPI001377133E|nr:hypothetical protein [Aquabacterium fontiphilum]